MEAAAELYSIPKESAAPKVGTPPAHHPRVKNLADDEELCAKVWKMLCEAYTDYDGQPARTAYEDHLDEIDKMYRMSNLRPTGRDAMITVSNVADSGFYRRVSIINANEVSILLPDNDLPAKYYVDEQAVGAGEYTDKEGKYIAECHNKLARYTFEQDGRRDKVDHINWLANKDANALVSVQWCRLVKTTTERRPVEWDENRVPTKFDFVKVKRAVKDCPSLLWHDIKDAWFDTTVDDIQKSNVITRFHPLIGELYDLQREGQVMNVGKITKDHYYTSEQPSDILQDRQTNAGESGHPNEPNGMLDAWDGWLRLAINEKGEFDPDGTVPTWYWATFVGPMHASKPVCLRLVANPNFHGDNPYKLLHSHRDCKGAIHMGLGTVLLSHTWEQKTNINQAIDNKNLRSRAPWILTGQANTRDMKFHPNDIVKVNFGTSLERVKVEDTTANTMAMHDRIEDIMDKTANTGKTIVGEAAGGRTSATEAQTVHDQAVKPWLRKSAYFSEQLFPWLWKMDAELWRQYGDPKAKVLILGSLIDPTMLWGPLRVEVTVIQEYASSTLIRQQLGAFIANDYPLAREEMTAEGRRIFWQDVWKIMQLPNGSLIFGMKDIGDAMRVAREESYTMLQQGQFIQPKPDENRLIHLETHENVYAEAKAALAAAVQGGEPGAEMLKRTLPILDMHIQATNALIKQSAQEAAMAQAQPQDGQQPGAMQPAPMSGQNNGDMMGATAGAQAPYA